MDGGNSSGNSLRARVRSGSSLPPAGAKGKAFRVAAAGLHWFRPVVHAPARNFSGRVEPDFHQRPTRPGRTFSCLDPGAWTRADFWVDRQFYPRAGFLFAAAYQNFSERSAVPARMDLLGHVDRWRAHALVCEFLPVALARAAARLRRPGVGGISDFLSRRVQP